MTKPTSRAVRGIKQGLEKFPRAALLRLRAYLDASGSIQLEEPS